MISKVNGATLVGIESKLVEVEIGLQPGLPKFVLVGLPDKAVEESQERVRSSLIQSGAIFPKQRIICNLAPADIKKEGPILDLSIAVGILLSMKKISSNITNNSLFIGELSLNGKVRTINGALSVALLCKKTGIKRLFLPIKNVEETLYVPGVDIYGVSHLEELLKNPNGLQINKPDPNHWPNQAKIQDEFDYADVKGQDHAIRALEIAAAGGHNLLMNGPPGSGKSMLAKRLPSILPPLSLEESLEVTQIYSAAGKLADGSGLIVNRPYRSPHHTISYAALIGGSGGKGIKPGEITLAHLGVLFLDEMPEFGKMELEALRQPLENRNITISRARASLKLPASCMLIGAMNPCPCGYRGYPEEKCISHYGQCSKYIKRISGPLLDRMDLSISVPPVPTQELSSTKNNHSSQEIRKRVIIARNIQIERYQKNITNSMIPSEKIKTYFTLKENSLNILNRFAEKHQFSGRAYYRIIKVGRTIADLENTQDIEPHHLLEAIQYRIPQQ